MGGLVLAVVAGTAIYSELLVRPPDAQGRVVVTYWEKWTNFEADAMRVVVDDFNRSQTKIFVNYLSVSGITEKTLMSIAANNPPDLAGLAAPNMPQYAYNQALTQMDDLAVEYGIKATDYTPVYWEMCRYRGKLWGMPATPATVALHLDMDSLAKAGLGPEDIPETIEELDEMDRKIVRRNKDGKVVMSGFLPTEPGWWNWAWCYFFGGSLWNGDDKITANSPENIRAFEWMASYSKRYGAGNMQAFKDGFGSFDSPQNAFLDGKVASVLQGVWMANFISKHKKDMTWTAVPFPYPADRPDLARSSAADLDIIVIPRGAKHAREAFEFLVYLQQQKNMEKLCLGQKKDSPLAEVSDTFLSDHPNPNIQLFRDLGIHKNAFTTPKTPLWQEYSATLGQAIDQINLGIKTPAEALAEVQRKMQPKLDEIREIELKREAAGK